MEKAVVKGLVFSNVYSGTFVNEEEGNTINYHHINFKGQYVDPKLTIDENIISQVEKDFSEGDLVNIDVELGFNKRTGKFTLGKVVGVVAE